jgi:hypothetical protein
MSGSRFASDLTVKLSLNAPSRPPPPFPLWRTGGGGGYHTHHLYCTVYYYVLYNVDIVVCYFK